MKEYKTKNLRNLGIIGHSGSGKTTLADAILYRTKSTDRFGKVDEETSTMDYDSEEKRRKISISTSVAQCEWNNVKINLLDMPGYFDFVGEVIQGLRAIDVALIVLSGTSGVQVGTEKAWEYVNEHKLPRAFYINKLDRENSNFQKSLSELKEKFGISVVPIQYPIGEELGFQGVINVISNKARIYNPKTDDIEDAEIPSDLKDKVEECKNMIMEAVAETNEQLLDKYFSEGTLSEEEIYRGLINGCAMGEIAPVMCGSALTGKGIKTLLDDIIECFPSPEEVSTLKAKTLKDNKEIDVKISEDSPFSAFVFKTIADPFIGKLSMFRVITGKAKQDIIVYNSNKDKQEKLGALYFMKGKQQVATNEIIAGDIGAVNKLQYTNTGDTLCDINYTIIYEETNFPEPSMSMAAVPKSKNDEDKIYSGLSRLLEEDPTFKITRDIENAETIISGTGETHLEVIACKLKNKFGAEVELQLPKVPYRETIKKTSDVQGKHKKQSGGHGQYGDVKIKFEPRFEGDDLEFVDKIVGGVVPKQYIPAVEKGLKECIQHGVLAGYPVIRLKATLHDGSYHPVDSSEMAFKMAASIAYKKGMQDAEPILLEPIMHVEVIVPDEYMGDIIGDINKKRGRVLGMEQSGKLQKVIAEVPQVEMFKYATDLRSLTQAKGSFSMKFERYEEVPATEASKIIEERKREKETL
ncbi:elongation factor G [Clostridium tetanomorphum]|uniref:Elongation factor G n=1 Tax=Clostridium tetanomorphum TaxID=1553 RepID=A0A923EDC5_CLOTT|nr:elongation factor G [Clostridium tetanomorphum]KAJ52200.1 elongation factor G [Clostridium tetanomorphum DSM 665]MBC2399979.1 elongation factor G [Clostridium tetanomorphum]MBP1863809.1 elongation factor G [Clostridium tetanomorphum]NRS86385.1 elongation factor G [Clostridium tetanomorphum]NRZ95585.1 elongation factor G [Clostridium tetanomorphum]